MKLLLDLSRAGGGTCPWRECLSSISCLNFSVLVFTSLRISGGAIPASRYSDGSGVGRRLPVTMRQALFNSELTFFAWKDFPHTGQQYSAVEYERADAVVLKVAGSVPQLELASLASRLFLVAVFPFVFLVCSAYDKVLSSVTPR